MTQYLVGTGGWSYFKTGNHPSLRSYSKIFNFVEVNYTFYELPNIRTVESWRRSVPSYFTFSVRCHQALTHKIGLKSGAKPIIQNVDLSRDKPAFSLDVTHSRLFGKGQHNIYHFIDDELVRLTTKPKRRVQRL